jgi:hypothetical protein
MLCEIFLKPIKIENILNVFKSTFNSKHPILFCMQFEKKKEITSPISLDQII